MKTYLDNFIQVILSLQHLTGLCPDVNKVWIKLIIERLQCLETWETYQSMDRTSIIVHERLRNEFDKQDVETV